MPRRIVFGATLIIVSAGVGWLAAASSTSAREQLAVQGSVRDPNGAPSMRAIPVGTASISGNVTAADGGRPVRDARVMLTGAATTPEGPPASGSSSSALSSSLSSSLALTGRAGGNSVLTLSVSRTAMTDDSGRFSFTRLPAGHFTLSISKNNFLTTSYGQKRPGGIGSTVLLADGQQRTADVALMRGGVITGTILADDGEPAPRVQVGAWRYTYVSGVKRLQQTGSTTSDDRGIYRLSGLQPGDYMVGATPNGFDQQVAARMNPDASAIERAIATGVVQPPAAPGFPSTVLVPINSGQPALSINNGMPSMPTFLPTFHPGTPVHANAQLIHVAGGDEHAGIDIPVQYVEAGSIQGTLASPLKQGVSVRFSLQSSDPTVDSTPTATLDPTGKFTFRSVTPGMYTILAQTTAAQAITVVNGVVSRSGGPGSTLADDDRLWGTASVTVEGSAPVATSISLRAGASISGVVFFEMEKPPDLTRSRMVVTASPAPGASPMTGPSSQGQVDSTGHFTLSGVTPGRYSLRLGSGGTLKSSMVGNVDTLDFPFAFSGTTDITDAVLTVTDKPGELSGVLTDAGGKPGMDYTVIVASADERFWSPGSRRVVITRTGADGKYTFRSLPPGDYFLVVTTDLEQGAQYDPEFLKSLNAIATRVNLVEGVKATQDLRVK